LRLFTVDRRNRLHEGFECALTVYDDVEPSYINELAHELCPGGVSLHGEAYLLRAEESALITDASTEIIFEWVRRAKYPHRPSRYQSLFAVADVESAKDFMRITNSPGSPIFEITADNAYRADMRLLDARMSAIVKSHFANLYWQGAPHPVEMPFWEWLVPCPMTIGRQISYPLG